MPAAHELVQVRREVELRADYRSEEIACPLVALEVHDLSGEGQLPIAAIRLTGAAIVWSAKDDSFQRQYFSGLEVDFDALEDFELASGCGDAELVAKLHQFFL